MSPVVCRFRQFGRNARLLVPACLMFPTVIYAQTVPTVTVDISVSGGADSNPFLEQNGTSTFSASLQIDPKVYWEDETTNVVVDASLRATQYMERYGNELGGRIGVDARKRLDARTSLAVSAGFQSSRSTLQDFLLGNRNAQLDAVIFPPIEYTDVTIAGRRTRIMALDSYLGLDHALGEDDSVNIFGATSYSKFGGSSVTDFRTGTLGVRYRRRVSERTSATAGVTTTVADYVGVDNGDARIISPQIGIENKLTERLQWTASLGASVASVNDERRLARTKTYFTGGLSLCDKGTKSALCVTMSRAAQPTALGGLRAITNVDFTYERQLNQKERLTISGRYGLTGRNSIATTTTLPNRSHLLGLSAAYTKNINERFAFIIAPSFTKAVESRLRNETNYAISVGIKLRVGKLR